MFSTFRRSGAELEALGRIRGWTRARFGLDAGAAILVAEVACALPGCPPLETVVAFWSAPDRRHHFKVFKPAAQVGPDDLPYAWMKDALRVPADAPMDCC